jgi:glycosyltransferase involved in cell wall biosynthesis
VDGAQLRILLASPAYWPAQAFGGPVVVARELVSRLVAAGHDVDVVTTTLEDVGRRPARWSSVGIVDGATVHYLGTPLRYRWMGVTPTLPVALQRLERPDVAHVFGFRDPVTTATAAWCRARRVPYVFEPLGMFRPRLRKVRLKRVFDATLGRGVAAGARAVIVSSAREADDVVACGVDPARVRVRGNGFPEPPPPGHGADPLAAAGVPDGAPAVLYVGRVAAGKGIDLLLEVVRRLPGAHLVLLGPDDRHGTMGDVLAAAADPRSAGRVHVLPPSDGPPWDAYRHATVVALPSAGDSFGLVAAEAAAAGTPVVVTDRAGVTDAFRAGEALVVPYDVDALTEAVGAVLSDGTLRGRLAHGGRAAAARSTWERVAAAQVELYREATASATASTKASTLGS